MTAQASSLRPARFVAPGKGLRRGSRPGRQSTRNLAEIVPVPLRARDHRKCREHSLLPLQVGPKSHAEFYEAAMLVAGVPLTPAMPMRKAATSIADVVKFIEHVRPPHIHLLGIGVDNRKAPKLLRAIEHYSAAPGSAWILIGFAP